VTLQSPDVTSFDGLAEGDEVWCLASLGVPYVVESVDGRRDRVRIAPHPAVGAGLRPIDLPADAAWMLTRERWDQVWYWPDRAGERYDEVVARFVAANPPASVVRGYFLDTAVGATNQGFVTPNPKAAMAFQVQRPTEGFGQVRVKPVFETVDGWVPVGPNLPLRVGMTCYRWSLSFGELVLNWQDFLPPGPV
jgi:hypothetical protein